MVYVVLGDLDHAYEQIDRQLSARSYPVWLRIPLFDAVRADPRWPELAARLEREFFRGERREPTWRRAGLLPWPVREPLMAGRTGN